ncbi:MAG: hypothetical protein V4864_21015 [Pseudomonadota bacterium]
MIDTVTFLLSAIWVSLVMALIKFLLDARWERTAIRTAILTDMRNLLRLSRENSDYLSGTAHYWLRVGDTLTRAPKDVPAPTLAYQTLLAKLHLLGPDVFARVLAFYSHYLYCDGLKVLLFSRVQEHATQGKPLTATDVDLLKMRRDRICDGLQGILLVAEVLGNGELHRLPTSYAIASTRAMASTVDAALLQEKQKKFLA